jgi:hypothetical protein
LVNNLLIINISKIKRTYLIYIRKKINRNVLNERQKDYWRFTHKGLQYLLEKESKENFEIFFCGHSTEDRTKKIILNMNWFSFWIESWFSVIIFKKL